MFGESLFEECIDLINKWNPKQKYPLELNYRDDLMNFIHDSLNNSSNRVFGGFGGSRNISVKKEDSRGICDIAVGNRAVGIELKKDLKSKSAINRLQGQIEDYEEDYSEGVIVVLVGDIDKYVETDLRNKLQKKLDKSPSFGNQFKLKLINKSYNKSESAEQKPRGLFGFDMGNINDLI